MTRGRKPKPKQQLRLTGAFRDDRHGGTIEPTTTAPEIPSWITGRAAELWAEVVAIVGPMGLLSADYTLGIALLVDAMADWIHYSRLISERPDDELVWRWGKRKSDAWNAVYKQCREFGMTPSSMRGVAVPHESSDEFDRWAATP